MIEKSGAAIMPIPLAVEAPASMLVLVLAVMPPMPPPVVELPPAAAVVLDALLLEDPLPAPPAAAVVVAVVVAPVEVDAVSSPQPNTPIKAEIHANAPIVPVWMNFMRRIMPSNWLFVTCARNKSSR